MRALSSVEMHRMLGIPRKVKNAVTDLLTRLYGAQGHHVAATALIKQLQATGDINSPAGHLALLELVQHHVAAGKALRAALSCAELNGGQKHADALHRQWMSATGHMETH